MTIKETKIVRAIPPAAGINRSGKQPQLLTDDKVRTLLSTPHEWYKIGVTTNWISGVKSNIENMTQKNIEHLAEKGNFKVKQRKNKQGDIDIYCKYVPNNPF
jgi:transcription antitermination factor NusG